MTQSEGIEVDFIDSNADIFGFSFEDKDLVYKRPPTSHRKQPLITDVTLYLQQKYSESNLIKLDREGVQNAARPLLFAVGEFNQRCGQLEDFLDIMHEVALSYKDCMQFAIVDSVNDEVNSYEYWYRESHGAPKIYGFDKQNRLHYMYGFKSWTDDLTDFCEKLFADQLYKSEAKPDMKSQEKLLIKVAVADNFDELLANNIDKDILLIFHRPWYSFTIEILEEVEKLAELLKDENILVLKMNSFENYIHPKYKACVFNMILLPKNNQNNFIKNEKYANYWYDGENHYSLANIIKFVAKNVTEQLKDYDRDGERIESIGFANT